MSNSIISSNLSSSSSSSAAASETNGDQQFVVSTRPPISTETASAVSPRLDETGVIYKRHHFGANYGFNQPAVSPSIAANSAAASNNVLSDTYSAVAADESTITSSPGTFLKIIIQKQIY